MTHEAIRKVIKNVTWFDEIYEQRLQANGSAPAQEAQP
jgi:hypothetical protein